MSETTVQYCNICVTSNFRASPSIITNDGKKNLKKDYIGFENNICNACTYISNRKKINWDEREKDLLKLLDKHRSKNGEYDCIVPGSGGKDSAYQAHVLKYKYGMNPLTVTWAPHIYTDIGWKNFQNWISIGGFDNYLFTPNGKIHRKLTRLSFKNLFHPFQPFIIGQRFLAPKIAEKYNIKLIFYGEHIAEYGIKNKEEGSLFDNSYYTVNEIDFNKINLSGISINNLLNEYDFKINDIKPYLPPLKKDVVRNQIEAHFLGYFLEWIPQEVYYYAAKNTGFKPNTERTQGTYSKYNSIDDKLDGFHYWTGLLKFGIGRCTHEASQEVRHGHITREEAVNLVKKYDQEFPSKYFDEILDYMDMSEIEFFDISEKFRNKNLWEQVDNNWKLKYEII